MTDAVIETPQSTATAPPQEPPLPEVLGARRLAGLLGKHTDEPVTATDVEALVDQEHLVAVDSYKGWPMYSAAAALALDTDLVRSVVAKRLTWEAASLPRDAAAERIGWHWSDLERLGREGRITTGRGGRYLIADLDKLAEEADGEQYVTAQAAASDVLEIRPTDFKYVEGAGWIEPADAYERAVGRHRTVTVPLYRLGDVRALLDMPGVDWEAVPGPAQGCPVPAARVGPARPHPGRRRPRLCAGPRRPARRDRVGVEQPVLRPVGAGREPAHGRNRAP
jgi:hypothetical protein